jgi:hypothetical protein
MNIKKICEHTVMELTMYCQDCEPLPPGDETEGKGENSTNYRVFQYCHWPNFLILVITRVEKSQTKLASIEFRRATLVKFVHLFDL